MRRIYLSFLGLGQYDKEKNTNYYLSTIYELKGKKSRETAFVQAAEIELLGGDGFDMVLIVATQKSFDSHFEELAGQMRKFGASPRYLIIDEEMEPEDQWRWFEAIMGHIEHGDALTVDLTHGFRSSSIIFSAAVNFLQKARNISLDAVYYGAFDKNRQLAPIIDMKDFYLINEWADAVGRLVDDADARKLATVADKSPSFQAGDLNDKAVIDAFNDLTDAIRNVDINNVVIKANDAIELIRKKETNASRTGKLLLQLVIDKFTLMTTDAPPSGKYDEVYFQMQIKIIELLLEHKLFMQAYTVMREFIASLGLIPFEQEGMKNKKRKKRRKIHAEVFIQMVQRDISKWDFLGGKAEIAERLRPFYETLAHIGVVDDIEIFIDELVAYRNGFDHCWTAVSGAQEDIPEKGSEFLGQLKRILRKMSESGLLNY